jgi:hypothetical protein
MHLWLASQNGKFSVQLFLAKSQAADVSFWHR